MEVFGSMNNKIGFCITLSLVFLLSFPLVSSDGGIIGPPQIYIQEKAQNAIIAWNGTEEILILSVDIQSSESTKVLRVIPLPSNPIEVKEGSFDSFTKLQEIINEKLTEIWNHSKRDGSDYEQGGNSLENVEITFQDTIGAHNITIVKIIDVTNFSDWATNFATSAGLVDITFSSKFQIMVEEYLKDNVSFFVFDIIDAAEDEHSINPIVYRFKTDFLFYPLKITAASDVGETYAQVNVFCIAKELIKEEVFSDISFYSNLDYYWYDDVVYDINLTEEELTEISPDICDLFKDDPILMDYYYYGKYSEIGGDIVAFEGDFSHPDFEITTEEEVFIERGTKNVVNLTVRNTGNTQIRGRLGIENGIDWLQHTWFSIEPSWYVTIDEGDETTFEILFDIPSNIPLGDYGLTYALRSSNYDLEKQKNVTLTIYEKTEDGAGLYQEIENIKTNMNYLLFTSVICLFLIVILTAAMIVVIKKK